MVVDRGFNCSWSTGLALNFSQPLRLCGSVDQSRDHLQSKSNTELFLDKGAANASVRDCGQYCMKSLAPFAEDALLEKGSHKGPDGATIVPA